MSEYYGIIHIARLLAATRVLWDQGCMPGVLEDTVPEQIPTCLQEVLDRVIHGQNEDGSWDDMPL